MPWMEFTRMFIWTPVRVQSTLYKPRTICLVTTPCAEAAIKAGAGKRVARPDGDKNKESRQVKPEADTSAPKDN